MLVLAIVLEESPGTKEQHSTCKRTKGDLGIVQQKHVADGYRKIVQVIVKSCVKSARVSMVT